MVSALAKSALNRKSILFLTFSSLILIALLVGIAKAAAPPASSYELSVSSVPNSQNYYLASFVVTPYNSSGLYADYETIILSSAAVNTVDIPYNVTAVGGSFVNSSAAIEAFNITIVGFPSVVSSTFTYKSAFSPGLGSKSVGFVGVSSNGTVITVIVFEVGDSVGVVVTRQLQNSTSTSTTQTIAQNYYQQLSAIPVTSSTSTSTVPTTSVSTTTVATTTIPTTTVPVSTSCNETTFIYQNNAPTVTCGNFAVAATSITPYNSYGNMGGASFNIYYNGVLTNVSYVGHGAWHRFVVDGSVLTMYMYTTSLSSASPQWASIYLNAGAMPASDAFSTSLTLSTNTTQSGTVYLFNVLLPVVSGMIPYTMVYYIRYPNTTTYTPYTTLSPNNYSVVPAGSSTLEINRNQFHTGVYSVEVEVTSSLGYSVYTNPVTFAVPGNSTSCPTPVVTSVTPDAAVPFTPIVIRGSNLWNYSFPWSYNSFAEVKFYNPTTQTWVAGSALSWSPVYINVSVPNIPPTVAPTSLDVILPCANWPDTGTGSAQFSFLAPAKTMSTSAAANTSIDWNYQLAQYVLQLNMHANVSGGVGPYLYTFYLRNASQGSYTALYTSGYVPTTAQGLGVTNASWSALKSGPIALFPGHTYYLQVEVQDSSGNTVYSNPVMFSFPSFSESSFVNVSFGIAQNLGIPPETPVLGLGSYDGGPGSFTIQSQWLNRSGGYYVLRVPVGSSVTYGYVSPILGGSHGTAYFQNIESSATTCGGLTGEYGTFTVGANGCLDDANYNNNYATTTVSSTTTIPYNSTNYNYIGNFAGTNVEMTLLQTQNVASYSDSYGGGTITNFYTTNPAYSCLNGQSLQVYTAPLQFGSYYLATNYNPNVAVPAGSAPCAYVTLEFSNPFSPEPQPGQIIYWSNYNYTGTWNGRQIGLKFAYNNSSQYIQPIESLPDAQLVGTLNNFHTNDPYHSCLDGESLNVWLAPNEYPGQYVVHDGNQGTQCAYLTLVFPYSTTNVPPPINNTNVWSSNPSVSSVNGTSCGSFVLSTSAIEQVNIPPHHIFNATCTWNGGPINVYYGSGDSGAILFNVTGLSDGKTYFNTVQFPNGGFSNVWCNSYYSSATLPAQSYRISMWVGLGGGACGNAFVQLQSQGQASNSLSIPLSVSAYPELQVIESGQSAYLLSSVSGGYSSDNYTYQWLVSQNNNSSFQPINGATKQIYLFNTTVGGPTGTFRFLLTVHNIYQSQVSIGQSAPVTVVVLAPGSSSRLSFNITSQNTALNLTNRASFDLNLQRENTYLYILPGQNTQGRSTFVVTNATSLTPPAPLGDKKLLGLNVSTLAHNITINFTMRYNCDIPASKIAPYVLENGAWTKITSYTVNQNNCTVSFTQHQDPVVGLIENTTNQTTTTPTSTTTAQPVTTIPSSSAGQGNAEYYAIGALVVVVVLAVIFVLARHRSGGAQQPPVVENNG